jgi:putative transcriptional regulator
MSNIKTIRESLRMTQAALADSVGVTQSAIAHYENERRKPGLDECRRIVTALNNSGAAVTLDEVFPPSQSLSAA